MDSNTHEVRAANWKAVVTQCQSRPKGQTIAEWCKQNDINPNTYYYWQRQVRKQFYQEMTPALPPAPGSEEVSVTFAEVPIRPSGDQCAAENSFHGFCPDAVICKGNHFIIDACHSGECVRVVKKHPSRNRFVIIAAAK